MVLLAAAVQRSWLNLVSATEGISRCPRQTAREAGASWQDPCRVISPANWGERAARPPEPQLRRDAGRAGATLCLRLCPGWDRPCQPRAQGCTPGTAGGSPLSPSLGSGPEEGGG